MNATSTYTPQTVWVDDSNVRAAALSGSRIACPYVKNKKRLSRSLVAQFILKNPRCKQIAITNALQANKGSLTKMLLKMFMDESTKLRHEPVNINRGSHYFLYWIEQ